MRNINEKNSTWWFQEIEVICEKLFIEPEEVCEFPDRTRRKLENDYYERGEIEIINEIKILVNNYNYVNKRKLVDLIKIEYN